MLDVTLKIQVSETNCAKGENFGVLGSNIWVDQGCRGKFIVILAGKSLLNALYGMLR